MQPDDAGAVLLQQGLGPAQRFGGRLRLEELVDGDPEEGVGAEESALGLERGGGLPYALPVQVGASGGAEDAFVGAEVLRVLLEGGFVELKGAGEVCVVG
ncbi:hypothetical protein [Nesterenkonia pannonica]|uniref:hypothetical protein n=1 Tax=Nesterenkonia pannonica TaxID=1548602 RepID=UPI0021648ED6|nr:hypothetical protein [Nesterenkonia pannonica]